MNKILSACFCMLLLSACASEPPPVVQVDSDTSPKINLDVLTVVVLDRTDGLTADTPYASNNFQPTTGECLASLGDG